MEMILYTLQDSENTINKTLVNGLTLQINLKRGVNIVTPSIPLADIPGVDFADYNYASIPELGRLYFVTQIKNVNSRVWVLELTCDALETYKADILAANARFTRNIKNGDYLDTTIDMSVIKTVAQYESNETVSTDQRTLILTTVGA